MLASNSLKATYSKVFSHHSRVDSHFSSGNPQNHPSRPRTAPHRGLRTARCRSAPATRGRTSSVDDVRRPTVCGRPPGRQGFRLHRRSTGSGRDVPCCPPASTRDSAYPGESVAPAGPRELSGALLAVDGQSRGRVAPDQPGAAPPAHSCCPPPPQQRASSSSPERRRNRNGLDLLSACMQHSCSMNAT